MLYIKSLSNAINKNLILRRGDNIIHVFIKNTYCRNTYELDMFEKVHGCIFILIYFTIALCTC